MEQEKRQKIRAWFEAKYREFRRTQPLYVEGEDGRRIRADTVTAFAEYIGISRDTLNKWMLHGVEPIGDNLDKVAYRVDYSIYDVLGKKRPNRLEILARKIWDRGDVYDHRVAEKFLERLADKVESRHENESGEKHRRVSVG